MKPTILRVAVIGTRGFPDVQGGVENHCEKLYTHLAETGCKITVFTRRHYVSSSLTAYKGISLISISCPKNKFFEAIIHTFKGIIKAGKLKPDLLHIHAIGPSLFTPFARLLGMKVVVTNHGPDYKRKKWPLPAKIFLMFCEWMGMTFANKIIAVAQYIADDIKSRYNRDATVIPNGVEISLPADTDETLTKFGLIKKRYILTVGRFVPEKGFDYLLEAFNEAAIEGWKLVIVGSADHEDKYSMNLIAKAKKNDNVVITGFIKGMPLHELYSHAGLFVLPSYYEGLPIVLLEAMSYGLPCLASNISANKNIVSSYERYFEAGDMQMLAGKIKEFTNKQWEDEERNKQIKMINEKYSWEKISDETLRIYNEIVSNSK